MAKPPSKRRGITLNPRAGRDSSPDLLGVRPEAFHSSPSDANGLNLEATSAGADHVRQTSEQPLDELRRISRHIDEHWERIAKESQRQLQQLEQQRSEIARQLRELQALQGRRRASGRVGVAIAFLTLAATAGLGFQHWPEVKGSAADLSRAISGVAQVEPQLRALNEQLANLTGETERVGGAMASLGEDFSRVHSDIGALRQVVDTLSEPRGAASKEGAGARRTAYTLSRNTATRGNPYRAMRPPLPW